MDERVVQFRIGAMILATLLILAILIGALGEWRWPFPDTYTVYVDFPQAPGVSRKSPIRKSGVVIGRVTDVRLMPDNKVRITAQIDRPYQLYENEVCRLIPSIIGDAVLEFARAEGAAVPGELVREKDIMRGVVSPDPIQVVGNLQQDLSTAIQSVNASSQEINKLVSRLSDLLQANEQRINSIVAKVDDTLTDMQKTARHVSQLTGDPEVQANIKRTADEVPKVLDEAGQTLRRMNETIRLANQNLENIQGFTRPLGERGTDVVASLERSVRNLETLMQQLAAFSQTLNNREGTLAQLMYDRTLYDRLEKTTANVEEITRQLKPVLQDARVFTDKIARHPELLGVRGALGGSSGTKGVPQVNWPRPNQP